MRGNVRNQNEVATEVGKEERAKEILKVDPKVKAKGGNQGEKGIKEFVIIVGKRGTRQMHVGRCMGLKIGIGKTKKNLPKKKQ